MPGFPDKFMQPSFLDEPPGAKLSTEAISTYGRAIRKLRQVHTDVQQHGAGLATPLIDTLGASTDGR